MKYDAIITEEDIRELIDSDFESPVGIKIISMKFNNDKQVIEVEFVTD